MRLDAIPVGNNPPEDVNVVVEVPVGGEPVKYEMDKASGTMFVDRFLYTAMRYPGNYGFVPHTLSEDGDPVDVLIANKRPIIPGAVINCRVVGVLNMKDEAGIDEKLIAVPSQSVSAMWDSVQTIEDLPEIMRQQIAHFFQHYKDLEANKWAEVAGWGGADAARAIIADALSRAQAA